MSQRLHPFDHVFGSVARERFPAIRAEALALRKDVTDPGHFASLAEVQRTLEVIESPELLAARPEAAAEYLLGLYAAYRFWDAGSRTVVLTRGEVERALAHPARRYGRVPSVYVQLPERWFWGQVEPEGPHEPVDGVFVAADAGGRELTVVAVLGLRPDRAGFSQVAVRTTLAEAWEAISAEMPSFAPAMEGGEAAGLRSLRSAVDVVGLALAAVGSCG